MAKRNNSSQQQGHGSNAMPPDVIKSFLDLQKDELQVRKQELELNQQQESNQKDIAKAGISAQLTDRNHHRDHIERRTKLRFVGGSILMTIVLTFLGVALYMGKEAVVMKALEISGIFISGFVGGYGLKASKQTPKNQSQD